MNREIKFRSWDDSKMIYSHNNSINNSNFQNTWFFEKIREDAIVMQYTGLKDKNGEEIYEGDICEVHSDGVGKIEWNEFDGGYDYIFSDEANVGIWEVKKGLVVIGNIYENPELFK